jgi:cytochrome c oxidase subunit 3
MLTFLELLQNISHLGRVNRLISCNGYYRRKFTLVYGEPILKKLEWITAYDRSHFIRYPFHTSFKWLVEDQVLNAREDTKLVAQMDFEALRGIKMIQKELYTSQTIRHPFHIVPQSPWPFLSGISVLTLTIGAVMYMHSYQNGGLTLSFGLFMVVATMAFWWRDVIREGTYEGRHTRAVQRGLRLGMVLFIVSEVMFFFSFFWAFFHSSLAPSIEIGCIWPPNGIDILNPWGIPLLNTYILLSSGITITYAHHSLLTADWENVIVGTVQTLALAVLFTALQFYEYLFAPFDISDGIYGSTFYLTTGFHGLHVIIGTIFIAVCLYRTLMGHFGRNHHVGFESAIWYWHFVDVVWLFLYVSIYIWGSN